MLYILMSACTNVTTNQLIIGGGGGPVQSLMQPPKTNPLQATSSFDTPTALSGLYLWILFGFSTGLLSCDLQRLVNKNIYIKHLLSIICFFFLFTVLDPSNRTNFWNTFVKTLGVYILFIMTTKSKAWAAVGIVVCLIIDQAIKTEINYIMGNEEVTNPTVQNKVERLKKYRKTLYSVIIVLSIIGFIEYYFYQKSEYGEDFDLWKFIIGTSHCEDK
jgi:hypothetical protein